MFFTRANGVCLANLDDAHCRLSKRRRASQSASGDLLQQVFDVTTILADGLPDDLRLHCAKSILLHPGMMLTFHTSSDTRLHCRLSVPQMASADALMLAHREKTTTTPHSMAARGHGCNVWNWPGISREAQGTANTARHQGHQHGSLDLCHCTYHTLKFWHQKSTL